MSTTASTNPYAVVEALATSWIARSDEIEDVCAPVRARMVDALDPRPGDVVLELAAGAGDTGFAAAARLGASGRLISTDVSPTMVDGARRRAAALGLRDVEHRVADAERTGLPDASVDGALCRFGYMLMEDPAAALVETRRVLRPGGRLVLAVWGPPEANPFFTTIGAVLARRGHAAPPPPGAPGIFALADPVGLGSRLEAAGFAGADIEEVPVTFPFAGVEAYLSLVEDTSGVLALALRALDEAERSRVAEEVGAALGAVTSASGGAIPGLALVATAHRPAEGSR